MSVGVLWEDSWTLQSFTPCKRCQYAIKAPSTIPWRSNNIQIFTAWSGMVKLASWGDPYFIFPSWSWGKIGCSMDRGRLNLQYHEITSYLHILHNLSNEINSTYQREVQCFFKSIPEFHQKNIQRGITKPFRALIVSCLVCVQWHRFIPKSNGRHLWPSLTLLQVRIFQMTVCLTKQFLNLCQTTSNNFGSTFQSKAATV